MDGLDDVAVIYPLTKEQQSILHHSLLLEDEAPYRLQTRMDIPSNIEFPLFQRAFEYLVHRHESLRTFILYEGLDEPAAVVRESVELPLIVHDYHALPSSEQSTALDRLAKQTMSTSLPLSSAPLFKVHLIKLSAQLYHMIVDMHHIIHDGWSGELMYSELQTVYLSLQRGRDPDLPEAGRFSDYANTRHATDEKTDHEFWLEKLDGIDHSSTKLFDIKTVGESVACGSQFSEIDSTRKTRLQALAQRLRITMNTLLEAAWALTLARYNDTDDIVIGIAISGRESSLATHERTYGLFTNTLPIRIDCNPALTLEDFLRNVLREWTLINEHSSLSIAEIQQLCEIPAGASLFDTLFVYQSFPGFTKTQSEALRFENVRTHENSPFPLTLEIFDGEQLGILALYTEDFSAASVCKLLHHFEVTLESMLNPLCLNQPISNVEFFTKADRQELSRLTSGDDPCDAGMSSIQAGFMQQCQDSPEAIAIVDASGTVTYRELAYLATGICQTLKNQGVLPGSRVAICMDRSRDMYAAILGTLLAHAVYVPLDSAYPAERLQYILEDSDARVLLATSLTTQNIGGSGIVRIDIDALDSIATYASLTDWQLPATTYWSTSAEHDHAYIMFTSGSTGNPKGVVGSQSATLNRLAWMWKTYPFQDDDKCCQKTSLSFVDSVWEIFGPLLQGVTTYLIPDADVRNLHRFVEIVEEQGITRLVVVPSMLGALLDSLDGHESKLQNLRVLTTSGEILPQQLARRFMTQFPSCVLLNLYGSTEVSGDITCAEITRSSLNVHMPIGRPIAGCRIHILDRLLRPVPIGAVGELCVAGIGLSAGYLHDSQTPSQQFVLTMPGESRIYRTGDLGRLTSAGEIEYLGRLDHQFKQHGVRIEPAEIEQAIEQFSGVSAALVTIRDERIHASFRTETSVLVDQIKLTEHLRTRLPEFMIPQRLEQVAAFVLLPNGKIDRNATPQALKTPALHKAVRVLPRTDTEKRVALIWQETLGGDTPTIHDNFVSSGGTSLQAMKFNARIFREFDKSIVARFLYVANISQLAAFLEPEDTGVNLTEERHDNTFEPLYFSSQQHSLFGALHIPTDAIRDSAVLICPSIGHEYMRAHRSLQKIAVEAARQGFYTLRFDLSGFGDSTGDPETATLAQWQQDIESAATFLRERSGKHSLILIGVRFGVTVMLDAGIDGVEKVIAWDPVLSGSTYLRHLESLHGFAMNDLDRYRFKQTQTHPSERFGYTYSESLLSDIESLNISARIKESAFTTHLISTGNLSAADIGQLAEYTNTDNVKQHTLPAVDAWSNFQESGRLLLSQSVVDLASSLTVA